MANISLATYAVVVRKKHSKVSETLGNIEGHDFLVLFRKFLQTRSTLKNDETRMHLLGVTGFAENDREIIGTIQTGEYGYSSRLINTKSAQVSYNRKTTDAEMLPFFFLAHFPDKENCGILILQRFKTYGIRKLFAHDFREYFATVLPEYVIDFDPIVHPQLLEEFKSKGKISKIRFRQFSIPKDLCDGFKKAIAPDDGYVEYSIIAKKSTTFDGIMNSLMGSGKEAMLTIPKPKRFKSSAVFLEVNLNGRRRTIDMRDPSHLRMYFDITGEVKLGSDGHPDLNSIAAISKDLLTDLWTVVREGAGV